MDSVDLKKTIANWHLWVCFGKPNPKVRGLHLESGHHITTSPVIKSFYFEGALYVETSSGSVYRLQDLDPHFIPEAKDYSPETWGCFAQILTDLGVPWLTEPVAGYEEDGIHWRVTEEKGLFTCNTHEYDRPSMVRVGEVTGFPSLQKARDAGLKAMRDRITNEGKAHRPLVVGSVGVIQWADEQPMKETHKERATTPPEKSPVNLAKALATLQEAFSLAKGARDCISKNKGYNKTLAREAHTSVVCENLVPAVSFAVEAFLEDSDPKAIERLASWLLAHNPYK